ncbi:MAG: leucine-rich repeat domain-containing protein [Lachnospiraceae bacterium]|nr:leucine-rich repeat domain-containing protein [Lachnospiraceae bacterium]
MKSLLIRISALLVTILCVTVFLPESAVCAEERWIKMDNGEYLGFDGSNGTITWYPDMGEKTLEIPSIIEGVTVKHLADSSFYGHKELETLIVPETVESIGEYAFGGSPKLKEIIFNAPETELSEYFFHGCDALKKVTVNGDLYTGKHGFQNSKVETVIVDGKLYIDDYGFYRCEALKEIDAKDGIISIGYLAFYECGNIKSIGNLDTVEYISPEAFRDCKLPGNVTVGEKSRTAPAESTNISLNIYDDSAMGDEYYGNMAASRPVQSYLYSEGDCFWRVENMGITVVEKYDRDFNLMEARRLESDLSTVWGGFFCGREYNFIITGNKNPKEDDGKVVVIVTKYDKNWKKLDDVKLKSLNTVTVFRSGAVRCAESNGYLYIHTCHTMYADSAGINHQANMVIEIDEKTMKAVDILDGTGWSKNTPSVSHSFNQFILIDEGNNLVFLDHGDASPRAVRLFMNGKKAGEKTFTSNKGTELLIYKIPEYKGTESTGYNKTGTSVGGLEETKNYYVTAYVTDEKGGNSGYDGIKNVYVAVTSKNKFSENGTSIKKITSYSASGSKSAGTPQMVSTGKTGGYIIWDIIENGKASGKIGYVKYDKKGKVSKIKTAHGYLSDCKPIYAGKKVIWYVTDNSRPVIYILDKKGITKKEL